MIAGTIVMEDIQLSFAQDPDKKHHIIFTVTDTGLTVPITESFSVPQVKFFKALAIAIHNDGTPDHELDYPDAESIMGEIRWIP